MPPSNRYFECTDAPNVRVMKPSNHVNVIGYIGSNQYAYALVSVDSDCPACFAAAQHTNIRKGSNSGKTFKNSPLYEGRLAKRLHKMC